jgi:hypothetical protein
VYIRPARLARLGAWDLWGYPGPGEGSGAVELFNSAFPLVKPVSCLHFRFRIPHPAILVAAVLMRSSMEEASGLLPAAVTGPVRAVDSSNRISRRHGAEASPASGECRICTSAASD